MKNHSWYLCQISLQIMPLPIQNEGNLRDVYKETTLLRQQERKLNVKSERETLFVVLYLACENIRFSCSSPAGTFGEAAPIGEERGETHVFAGYSLLKLYAKKSGHFNFITVSLLLADLHPDKILLFLRCQEHQKCIENLGSKTWKLRSRKLTRFTEINPTS